LQVFCFIFCLYSLHFLSWINKVWECRIVSPRKRIDLSPLILCLRLSRLWKLLLNLVRNSLTYTFIYVIVRASCRTINRKFNNLLLFNNRLKISALKLMKLLFDFSQRIKWTRLCLYELWVVIERCISLFTNRRWEFIERTMQPNRERYSW